MILQNIKAWFVKCEPKKEHKTKTGTIKFFNRRRGYGFIRSRQTLKDVYVHIKDAKDRLYAGAKVRFKLERNEKGLRARNVELLVN